MKYLYKYTININNCKKKFYVSDLMNKDKFTPIILPIFIIIIWYIITSVLELVNPYFLPSPGSVCHSAWNIIQSGELFVDTMDTLFKVFVVWHLHLL